MEVNASFIQKRKYEFDLNEEEEEEIDIGSFSSLSHDEEEDGGGGGGGGGDEVSSYSFGSSSSSELLEDATSSSLDSSSSSSSSNGPLFEMSSLISQLPVKRGLSKHFEGKSQSFTSLSNVKSLEDLIKPERRLPFKKKLKSSKSYAWSLDTSSSLSQKNSSKPITKIKNPNYSKGSLSSLDNMKKHSFSKTSLGTINWVDN